MTTYRINFGNGQVSRDFLSLSDAIKLLRECRRSGLDPHAGSYFIEKEIECDHWQRLEEQDPSDRVVKVVE
jgi:hypothetical protein